MKEHILSMKKTHPAACGYCGRRTAMKCGICNTHLCLKSGTSNTTMTCPFDFHNDRLYGLGYKDRIDMFNGSKNAKMLKEKKGNSNYMDELIEKYKRENR